MLSFDQCLSLVNDVISYYQYQYRYLGYDACEDIMQEGRMAVLHAMELYDESLGSFKSYAAMWIKSYVYDYVNKVVSPVSVSREVRRKINMIRECQEKYPYADIDELSKMTGLSEYQVRQYMKGISKVSLDAYVDEDEKISGLDMLVDNSKEEASKELVINDTMKRIAEMLSDKDRSVLFGYYGIGCAKKSQAEIADELGVSHQAVSKIINRIINNLRKALVE